MKPLKKGTQLALGVGIALAASRTKAAPLVVVILAAAIVYQLLTF
jgi:hypothetical protein